MDLVTRRAHVGTRGLLGHDGLCSRKSIKQRQMHRLLRVCLGLIDAFEALGGRWPVTILFWG